MENIKQTCKNSVASSQKEELERMQEIIRTSIMPEHLSLLQNGLQQMNDTLHHYCETLINPLGDIKNYLATIDIKIGNGNAPSVDESSVFFFFASIFFLCFS